MSDPILKHAFTPEELEQIDRVYETVWMVMIANSMYAGWQRQDTLKLALRKRLLAFASHGVSEPGKLADVTLRNFGLR